MELNYGELLVIWDALKKLGDGKVLLAKEDALVPYGEVRVKDLMKKVSDAAIRKEKEHKLLKMRQKD